MGFNCSFSSARWRKRRTWQIQQCGIAPGMARNKTDMGTGELLRLGPHPKYSTVHGTLRKKGSCRNQWNQQYLTWEREIKRFTFYFKLYSLKNDGRALHMGHVSMWRAGDRNQSFPPLCGSEDQTPAVTLPTEPFHQAYTILNSEGNHFVKLH